MTDSLNELKTKIATFVQERDWAQFHSPKNLAMAMIVEAAEVVEHFQWDTLEESFRPNDAKKKEIGYELADTLVYLIRLADVVGIDLIACANEKIELNAKKYPAEKCKGSNAKYTQYD
jgi:dCTP diphosphatase